jgi:hypothetical protein
MCSSVGFHAWDHVVPELAPYVPSPLDSILRRPLEYLLFLWTIARKKYVKLPTCIISEWIY